MILFMEKKDKKKISEFLNFLKDSSWQERTEIFKLAEKEGFHILGTRFYSPIPILSKLSENAFAIRNNCHINWNEQNQIELLKKLGIYSNEFLNLIQKGDYILKNGSFGVYDAPIYYAIIRHFKPKNIIEIGAGHSTKLAYEASIKNSNTNITAIDPFVKKLRKIKLPKKVTFIEKSVQEVPLSFFEKLSENDILFFDGTHVSKIGSDVNFIILQVLPILKPGVLIHFHDIFLPKEYPRKWLREDLLFWNEQYLLNAFLIGNNDFEILLSNSILGMKYPEKLKEFVQIDSPPGGGSFWFRRK